MGKIVLVCFFAIVILSCKDQNEFEFPLIQTGEVTDITDTGAVFHAKIFYTAKDNISEYGFVWGLTENPDVQSSKAVIVDSPKPGVIREVIKYDLFPDTDYYVRAFARTSDYLTYGKEVSFRSRGSLPPEIFDFNPKEGTAGTRITITGINFSSCLSGNRVEIGRFTAIIEKASNDSLVIRLPDNLTTSGSEKIILQTVNHRIVSEQAFTLLGCNITGYRPDRLMGGDNIYLKASGYSPVITENVLKLGSVTAQITEIRNDTLVALVPYNTATGLNEVSLTVNNLTCYSKDSIYVRNPWSKKGGSFSYCRNGAISFSIGTDGYYGFGFGGGLYYEPYNDLMKINLENQTLTQCAELPDTARENAIAFSINGKGYAGLGNYGGIFFFRDLYEYDPANDEWTKKSDFPGLLQVDLFYLTINNKAYLGFGDIINYGPHEFWEYDPEKDKWTRKADYPGDMGSRGVTGFEYDNNGYIGLGRTLMDQNLKDFWKYDPVTDTWSRLADFPGSGRTYAVSFSIDKFGYLGLGASSSGSLNDFWRYDFEADRWTRIADMPFKSRYGASSFISGKTAYIWSGLNCPYDECLIIFNPYDLH